jgi:hypothetical protein
VGYYALVLLDAYVDAQLYDFDISPDLVLNVQPTRIERERQSPPAYGMHWSIKFPHFISFIPFSTKIQHFFAK